MHRFNIQFQVLAGIGMVLLVLNPSQASPNRVAVAQVETQTSSVPSQIYLPLIINQTQGSSSPSARRVNAPYFDGSVVFSQTAIFWFGRISPTENYADVRVGYNSAELYVNVTTIDRRLWYDTTPTPSDLNNWDAVTLYLSLGGNNGNTPGTNAYRFDAQFSWSEARTNYQVAYRGNGTGWTTTTTSFTTEPGWRGNAPNDNIDDKGWTMTFHIPFTSLGLAGAPALQTKWGMAIALHDRDDAVGTSIADKVWPENMSTANPSSWGQLAFGLPTYTAPSVTPRSTVAIRHSLNGTIVTDGAVGGYTNCGGSLDYWTQWG